MTLHNAGLGRPYHSSYSDPERSVPEMPGDGVRAAIIEVKQKLPKCAQTLGDTWLRAIVEAAALAIRKQCDEELRERLEREQERLEAQAGGEWRMDNVNLSMAHAEGVANLLDSIFEEGADRG